MANLREIGKKRKREDSNENLAVEPTKKAKYAFEMVPNSIAFFACDNMQKDVEGKSELQVFEIQEGFKSDLWSSKFKASRINNQKHILRSVIFDNLQSDIDPYINGAGHFCHAPEHLEQLNKSISKFIRTAETDGIYIRANAIKKILNYHFLKYNFCHKSDSHQYDVVAKKNKNRVLEHIFRLKVMQRLFLMSKENLKNFLPSKMMIVCNEDAEGDKIKAFTNGIVDFFGKNNDIIIKANTGYVGKGNAFFKTNDASAIEAYFKEHKENNTLFVIESICHLGQSKKHPGIFRTYRTLGTLEFDSESIDLNVINLWKTIGEKTNSHSHGKAKYYLEGIEESYEKDKTTTHSKIPPAKVEKHLNLEEKLPGRYKQIEELASELKQMDLDKVFNELAVFELNEALAKSQPCVFFSNKARSYTEGLLDHIFIYHGVLQTKFNSKKEILIDEYNKLDKNRNWEKLTEATLLLLDPEIDPKDAELALGGIIHRNAKMADEAVDSVIADLGNFTPVAPGYY